MEPTIKNKMENFEIRFRSKYKGKVKENLSESFNIFAEFFMLTIVFIFCLLSFLNYGNTKIEDSPLETFVIILLSLLIVFFLLTSFIRPFISFYNKGLKGNLVFTFYENENRKIYCRCYGSKHGKNIQYDVLCKSIKFQKYSVKVKYKAFKYLRIPMKFLNETDINRLKNVQSLIENNTKTTQNKEKN